MAASDVEQPSLYDRFMHTDENDENDDSAMSLVDHLEELRKRIFVCLIFVAIGTIVAFIFRTPIIALLDAPMPMQTGPLSKVLNHSLTVTGIGDAFTVSIKLSLVFGIIFALPAILYETWAFVAPGLYEREKKHAVPFILLGLLLFAMGITLGYFILRFPIDFLVNFGASSFNEIISADSYFTFVAYFLLAFGIIFELPLVLTFLAMIHVVSEDFLRSKRAIAHVIMWAASTVLTPGADLYSPVFIGVSLSILFEFSIILIHFVVRRAPAEDAA
jgi:sec-independent protein translocase protein TatC